jgi:2-oxoglutarate dehydrogenase complex dehydrogenase (E1) component-like enzyme
LLRLPAASSTIDDLVNGGFKPFSDDAVISDPQAVKKVVLCSGKVYYDLIEARKKSEDRSVAIVRLEQFYPFPATSVRETLARYPNSTQLVWAQEEPQNMGGWTFVHDRLESLLSARPRYVGRSASASPATGSYSIHQKEQAELLTEALKT